MCRTCNGQKGDLMPEELGLARESIPLEPVTLRGREIPVVLESWGYEKLAKEAWDKLYRDGWHFQVELTVCYPPDSKPRIWGAERLFFTMQQA